LVSTASKIGVASALKMEGEAEGLVVIMKRGVGCTDEFSNLEGLSKLMS
jgi:hypothetical protein